MLKRKFPFNDLHIPRGLRTNTSFPIKAWTGQRREHLEGTRAMMQHLPHDLISTSLNSGDASAADGAMWALKCFSAVNELGYPVPVACQVCASPPPPHRHPTVACFCSLGAQLDGAANFQNKINV